MITIIDLTKMYGGFAAVNNISMEIPTGEVFALLGANGAGKTTTVKTIVGILKPTKGTIKVDGVDVCEKPLDVKRKIGYVPENPPLFKNLTGWEYMELVGKLYQVPDPVLKERVENLFCQFLLRDSGEKLIAAYSKGMTQKLAIAAALVHNPAVLILDEPFSGLDASSAAMLKQVFSSFARHDKTVVFCSHILEVVEKLCKRLAIIHHGKILASGTMESVVARTGKSNLEDAFIDLTGETDITGQADDIVAALVEE